MPTVNKDKCLQPGCPATGTNKGLCLKHYGQAKKLVDAGKTTWDQLIAVDLARGEVSEFEREFLKRVQSREE